MEKAYDRVNRKKLLEVMRGYAVQEKLVDVIERIYDGGMVKIELEGIMNGWCINDSGVRQGCPLSPLLFNIYVKRIRHECDFILFSKIQSWCKHGFMYLMVDRDGLIMGKSQAGYLYADDVCLIASNEQDLQMIFDSISRCNQ